MRGFAQEWKRRERVQVLGEWLGICAVTAWLFYDSVWAFGALLPGLVPWAKARREQFARKRRRLYAGQFTEGMKALAAAVSAGYSVERGVSEAYRDLQMIHGRDNAMMEEFLDMDAGLKMNLSIEQLFEDLAGRSKIADAASFSQVLAAAKRTGGNLPELMEQTARTMEEKELVNREIEVLLAGRVYEQRIMNLIPFGMIVYMRLGSPGYLDSLYHTAAGVCLMTLCLAVYGTAIYMGGRVLQIEI